MIKLKKRCKEFINIIKYISNINIETVLSFNKEGINIRVVDLANTMLSNITINKDFFEEYNIKDDISFTINFVILSKIVNSMKNGFKMISDDNKLVFEDLKKKMKRSIVKYVSSKDEREDPKIDFSYTYKIKLSEFIDAIKTSKEVDDLVILNNKNGLMLKAKGNLEHLEMQILEGDKNEDINVYINSSYFEKIECLNELCDDIILSYNKDSPVYYSLESENTHVEGWIAPRMEETI